MAHLTASPQACFAELPQPLIPTHRNPEYSDLFAVGYGSFDFTKQSGGLVCCYSLKNPSHPEYICSFESGVMAVDFHPTHTSLLAVGLYDGSVAVLDMRQKQPKPIFESTVRTGKHKDPVWQVAWQEEDLSKTLSFASVSSDGRVTLWTMSKSELQHQDVMELKLVVRRHALIRSTRVPPSAPSLLMALAAPLSEKRVGRHTEATRTAGTSF